MHTASSNQPTNDDLRSRSSQANRRVAPRTRPMHRAGSVELVVSARAGDDEAWHEIIRRYAPLVFGRARRIGLSPAQVDDAAQITWVRLAASLDTIRQPERLAGWLATTARNAAVDLLRLERGLVPTEEFDRREHPGAAPDAELLAADASAAVHAAVDTLDEHQRALVYLRYLRDEPLPYAEIVEHLDIRPGAIGPTLGRALGRMRNYPDIAGHR